MDGGIACSRLSVEHRSWRMDYPHTDWEGGFYPITMHFRESYPYKPPKCKFPQDFFHSNFYPSGKDNVEYKRRVRQLSNIQLFSDITSL